MTPMKDVLCNLLYDTNEFCGLCFKQIRENAYHVQDEIFMEEQHNAEEMQNILTFVLGTQILDCLSSCDPICEQCTRSAINSYKFIKMCKNNSTSLSTVIDGLTGCIGNTAEDIDYYNTLFLTINTNDTSSKQFYDERRSIHIRAAIRRLRTLSTSRFNKVKRKSYFDYSNFEGNMSEGLSDLEKLDCLPTDVVKRVTKKGICTVLYFKNGTRTFQCNICHILFPRFYSVERHNATVHAAGEPERRPYQRLHISKEDAQERKNRICTVLIEDDTEKYQCNACSTVFKTYGSVQCHYSRFHIGKRIGGSELLICSQCGKTFKEKCTLKKHELMHTSEETKVSCPICNKEYRSVEYLKVHLCNPNNERIIKPKLFVCDICGKKYGKRNSLSYHIKYMHQREGFICMWCEKKLPSQAALNAHIVTHTKERNYKCELCGGLYVTRSALKTHTRIHTGEKPYRCEASGCDLSFISASRRSEHYKRRHTEPSIECDICHKVFRTRQALVKHMKRHYNPRSSLYEPKGKAKKVEHFSLSHIMMDQKYNLCSS